MHNEILLFILKIVKLIIDKPIFFGLIAGFSTFFWLSFKKREKEMLEGVSSFFLIIGFSWLLTWFCLTWFNIYSPTKDLFFWTISSFIGFFLALAFERKFLPKFEKLLKENTKTSDLERDKKTDIRDFENIKKNISYDPVEFFKKDAWFLGLDDEKNPIYYNSKKLPHFQISGKSGVGKSVLLGLLAYQSVLKDESCIVFDPKHGGDEYFPDVCKKACDSIGVNFNFIDLREAIAQINILQGADADDIANLLITNFLLEDRGDPADFFRGKDRAMARFVAKNYKNGDTLASINAEYNKFFRAKENGGDGFANQMDEISEVISINASNGLNLKNMIENKEFIYIAGDWLDPKFIKAQRMVLARIIQIVGKRDNRQSEPNQVGILLDEFSFQISKIFGDSLKIIRDKGVHFVLAHQGLKDLEDCPQNMNEKQFSSSVLTNCGLKFTYRSADVETAEYFSELSGDILVDDEIRHLDKSLSLTETVSHERQIRQTEKKYIDVNTMLMLPENCGIFFGDGLAKISNISPIKVSKTIEARLIQSFDSHIESKNNDNDFLEFEELN